MRIAQLWNWPSDTWAQVVLVLISRGATLLGDLGSSGKGTDLDRKVFAAFGSTLNSADGLKPDLPPCFLIGSLAHGGFSRRYSDIDVAVVTETGLTPEDLEAMRADGAALLIDEPTDLPKPTASALTELESALRGFPIEELIVK